MKRRYLAAVLMCSVCLATAAGPVMAASNTTSEASEEETKDETAEDEEESDSDEAGAEDSEIEEETAGESDGEASDSESADEENADTADEAEEEIPERPEYKALDYVTLGEYKGLTIAREDLGVDDVTDEDVDAYVKSSISSMASSMEAVLENLTEGTVEDGDIANIDYVGKKDGEAFDGGTDEGYDLTIGSGSFIEGFEDGLIGAKIGETVDLNLTFPEDYKNEELAGQDVVFTVTVNSVKRVPEITDDLVNSVTDGAYSDVASYTEYIREYMESQFQYQYESAVQNMALSMVEEASEIKGYPDGLQDYTKKFIHSYYERYAQMYGMEFADFLEYMGMTEEEFDEVSEESAIENMNREMCLKAILESEEVEVTDEDYEELAKSYGYESAEAMNEEGGFAGQESIYLNVLQDKALEILTANTTVKEAE